MASLAESVEYLTKEVSALAGTAVVLTRKVEHLQATYVPRTEVEEKAEQQVQTLKVIKTIVVASALVITAILGGFGWLQHSANVRQERVGKDGAKVIVCLYGELAAHRYFDREYSLNAAKELGIYDTIKKLSDEIPQTAFDPLKLHDACGPIATAINSGKYNYGLSKEGK